MATGNLLLGLGRGSIGDVTLYRSQGQQRARARNRKPKNPQTNTQTAQRIIMRQAVRAYSAMKEICDHSFQGLSYGAENMNRFNSLNAKMMRSLAIAETLQSGGYYGNFSDVALPKVAINPYIVSEGTLPTIPVSIANEGSPVVAQIGTNAPATLSYNDVIAALGLQQGDQITVLQINEDYDFSYGRFILAPKSGDYTKLVTDAAEANEKNLNAVVFAIADGKLTVNVGIGDDEMCACAVIVSRKSGTTWLRSSSKFVLGPGAVAYPLSEFILGNAEVTIGESPYYLNQANRTTQEGGGENP